MNKIQMVGQSTLRAWKPGFVGPLLNGGKTILEIERDLPWALIHKDTVSNLVVDGGMTLAAQLMVDIAPVGLTYHAVGTETVPPAATDVKLGNEVTRSALVQKLVSGPQLILTAFYLSGSITYYIKEGGIFGAAATGTKDSGTLFCHFLQSYNNSVSPADLSFEYKLTMYNYP